VYNYHEMDPMEYRLNAIQDATTVWKYTGESKLIPIIVTTTYYNEEGVAVGYSSEHGVEVAHYERISNYGDTEWVEEAESV